MEQYYIHLQIKLTAFTKVYISRHVDNYEHVYSLRVVLIYEICQINVDQICFVGAFEEGSELCFNGKRALLSSRVYLLWFFAIMH